MEDEKGELTEKVERDYRRGREEAGVVRPTHRLRVSLPPQGSVRFCLLMHAVLSAPEEHGAL